MHLSNKVFAFLFLKLIYATKEEVEKIFQLKIRHNSIKSNPEDIFEEDFNTNELSEEWKENLDFKYEEYFKTDTQVYTDAIKYLKIDKSLKHKIYGMNFLRFEYYSFHIKKLFDSHKSNAEVHKPNDKNWCLYVHEQQKKYVFGKIVKKYINDLIFHSIIVYKFLINANKICRSLYNTYGKLNDNQKNNLLVKSKIPLYITLLEPLISIYEDWIDFKEDFSMRYLLKIINLIMSELAKMPLQKSELDLNIRPLWHTFQNNF